MSAAADPLRLSIGERLKLALPGPWHLRNILRRARLRGEAELHLVPFLADRQRLALDIGANKGVYSAALRPYCAGVHAFEPHPKMLRFLRRNIGAWAGVHACALGAENGTAELRIPRWKSGYSNQGASLSTLKVAADYFPVPVTTARLDDLDLAPVGFMKIDVEGHEQAVLTGAQGTIARDRPVLLIEIEEKHTKRPLEDSIAAVCALGYRCLALHRGVLTLWEHLDAETHHRSPADPGDYLFNFIFLPAPR